MQELKQHKLPKSA